MYRCSVGSNNIIYFSSVDCCLCGWPACSYKPHEGLFIRPGGSTQACFSTHAPCSLSAQRHAYLKQWLTSRAFHFHRELVGIVRSSVSAHVSEPVEPRSCRHGWINDVNLQLAQVVPESDQGTTLARGNWVGNRPRSAGTQIFCLDLDQV